jgi:hypothetical protein
MRGSEKVISAILPVWGAIDYVYFHLSRLQPVNLSDGNVFRVRLTRYHGCPLATEDGKVIDDGDLLLKIHLYNYQLMKQMKHLHKEISRALHVYQEVESSLPGLAQYLSNHQRSEEIKGILGITILNRGVKNLGFEIFAMDNIWYRLWKTSYMIPMYWFCQGKVSKWNKKMQPKYLVMSKERLLQTYLDGRRNYDQGQGCH